MQLIEIGQSTMSPVTKGVSSHCRWSIALSAEAKRLEGEAIDKVKASTEIDRIMNWK